MVNYFAVDPLHYQTDIRRKQQTLRSFSRLLQRTFNKTKQEVFDQSSAYVGKPRELLNFLFAVSSWNHLAKYELKPKARTLAITTLICVAESSFSGRNQDRLSKFLSLLPDQDKRMLLNSFIFSPNQHDFPIPLTEQRHLMYEEAINSHRPEMRQHYETQHCFSTAADGETFCECGGWLSGQPQATLDRLLKELSKRLYDMRSAVVHDASPVGFCHTEQRPEGYASWGMTIVDTYARRDQGYSISYESSISRGQLEEIFKRGMWEAYKKGCPG